MGATKLVPDIDWVTPVLGAVQILLEVILPYCGRISSAIFQLTIGIIQAAKNAAKVREEIVGGFDDIDVMFSQVELVLEIYRGDKNIEKASLKLIATTFHAIECVIGFFESSICTSPPPRRSD